MLVVLSEIMCLDTIKAQGVYPDEFYTDIDRFKASSISFRDATIIVIFGGNFRLNKKHTLEFVKTLMKRATSDSDIGISHVYVVSDMTIAGLRSYYKYTGNIDSVSIMHGWSSVKDNVNIWVKLRNEPKETVCYLSDYDNGVVDEALKRYADRHKADDEYIRLIKVPNLRKMLSAT